MKGLNMWELILTLQVYTFIPPVQSIIEFNTQQECMDRIYLMREQHEDLFKLFPIKAVCQIEEGD